MINRPAARIAATLGLLLAAIVGPGSAQEPAKSKARPAPAARGMVELNSATAEELAQLPGVGEATARKIIAGRPYRSIDDLVPAGVPLRTVERMKPHIAIRPPATKVETTRTPAAAAAPAHKSVDLNTADLGALETLPGIGPATAKAIVAGRPYSSIDDLERVKGLGRSKIGAIRDLVKVGVIPSTAAVPAVATPAPAAAPEPRVSPRAATSKGAMTTPKAATTGPKLAPGQKVDLNTASKQELDALPGIGPVKAQAIIDARPFKSIEDVMRVKGIKDGEFGKIKDVITVR